MSKKNMLHTINDKDAAEVSLILLKSFLPYEYTVNKIIRYKYDDKDGVDAEEAVYVYVSAKTIDEHFRNAKWKDKEIIVQLIEKDRYHDYPYFHASSRFIDQNIKSYTQHEFLANQIEAIEYLQEKQLI